MSVECVISKYQPRSLSVRSEVIGPSGVRALPLAAGINECGHYFGPSGVRALPLAAGINEGGHYFRYFFLFLFSCFLVLTAVVKIPEGVVVGIQIFAWAPK